MKKALALLLALLMMAGLLAGCGDSTEEKPSTEPSAGTDPTTVPSFVPVEDGDIADYELPLTEDDVKFTYWIPNGQSFTDFSTYDDNLFYQWMEDQTGIDIIFEHPAVGSEKESFQTMILSNNYPEFIQSIKGYYDGGVDKAISDGVLLALNDYVDMYMPHYRQMVYGTQETFIQAVSDAGNLWGVHHIVDVPQGSWIGLGVREDWLNKAGLTTADCATIDGMEQVLTALKEYTHENAGPLWLQTGNTMASDAVSSAWDIGAFTSGHQFANENGKVVYSATKPEFAEYARKMADWYAKGLINKNYVGENSWGTPQDYWANSEVGIADFIYTNDEMFKAAAAVSELQPEPDFMIQALTAPKLNASDSWSDIHFRNTQDKIRAGNSMGITVAALPNIELACKFWDYAWTDEAKIASNWGPTVGEKGDTNATYYVDEADSNGDGHKECYQPWLMERLSNNVTYVQYKVAVHNGPTYSIWSREWSALSTRQMEYQNIWNEAGNDYVLPEGLTLTKEEGDAASSIIANADTTAKEWLVAVITGEKSADTWETEVLSVIEGYGIHEAEGYRQAALDRYNARIAFIND